MACSVRHELSTSIISLTGRFVFDVHRDFRQAYEQALAREQTQVIELDLSGVEYLDSSALGMMLLMKERVAPSGRQIIIKGPKPLVRQILETANFHKLFTII